MSTDITAEKYRAYAQVLDACPDVPDAQEARAIANSLDAAQARDALVEELFAVYRNEVAGHEMDPATATRDGIYAILDHLVAQGHLIPDGADLATQAK
ncbi:hypothetical protein ACWFRB_09230 [Rhodococcus sp. NPDC055112]